MEMLILILSGLSIFIGIVALLIGSVGLIRLPDVFCRIHAVGMIDTAGASFIILGMVIYEGFTLVTVKLLFIGNSKIRDLVNSIQIINSNLKDL